MNIKTLILSICLIGYCTFLSGQIITFNEGFLKNQYYLDGKETFKSEISNLLMNNDESKFMWYKYKSQKTVEIVSGIISGVGLLAGSFSNNYDIQIAGYSVGLVSGIVSIIYYYNGKKSHINAINKFNTDKSTSYIIKPSSEGIGISLHF